MGDGAMCHYCRKYKCECDEPASPAMTGKPPDQFLPCNIDAKDKRLAKKLRKITDDNSADTYTAYGFQCTECHEVWDAPDFDGSTKPESVTCSNCYGDKIRIVTLRLQVIAP